MGAWLRFMQWMKFVQDYQIELSKFIEIREVFVITFLLSDNVN
jgi:hypothetical protein